VVVEKKTVAPGMTHAQTKNAPAMTQIKTRWGFALAVGGQELEEDETEIDAWCDDTVFPTICVTFQCQLCNHRIQVSYNRRDGLEDQSNKETINWSYDPDPDGVCDFD